MVDENIKKFEERMQSKIIRFTDHTQTYTTYYHIANPNSTTDDGFVDIESLVGARSPFRYQKINGFPIYGLEALIPQLSDTDFGLDSNIEGEAIILPGTIKPCPNSFFLIDHLELPAIFRVTEISYDNIRPDNFYQIHYKLEFIDEERIQQLDQKVLEDCECVLENIGSEERCIIQSKDYSQLQKIQTLYRDMVSTYLDIFYDSTHNSLISHYKDDKYLYDPFMTYFINTHGLFEQKNSFKVIRLTDQMNDPYFKIKYERSLYRLIERQDPMLINQVPYNLVVAAANENSTFHFHYAYDIYAVDLVGLYNGSGILGMDYIFSDEMVEKIKNGEECKDNPFLDMMIKYIHKKEISIYDIDLEMHRELLHLHSNIEIYFFTPIILFILKEVMKNY